MKKFKRATALLTAACLMVPALPVSADGGEQISTDTTASNGVTVESILDNYHEQIFQKRMQSGLSAASQSISDDIEEIRQETVEALEEIGYTAYSVTPENYYAVEDELNTDFASMELDPESSYIVVIGSDEGEDGTTAGTSFTYTYNGTTYTMRYLTVTSEAEDSYGKASTVNLLTSASKTLITNCLNTAISLYLGEVSTTLGTVASICGLDISKFSTSQTSTLYLNAGTNWTRIYTQVKNSTTGEWVIGCSVEYARCRSYMSGLYYSASTNQYEKVPEDDTSTTVYSENCKIQSWQKKNAAIGYENSTVIYDTTGAIKYKYGNTTKITHTCG